EDNLTITAFAKPTPNFSVNPEAVCLGEEMNFTDLSVEGDGTIIQWIWNFGNGAGNSGPNPSYTYPNTGIYNVSLTVKDDNECNANIQIEGAAVVSETPNISVLTSPNPPAACEAPLTVSFTNNSSSNSPSGGGLTYSWTFGEGTTSDAENPAPVTYDENGFYTVTITGTDNAGCSGSQIINVSVQEPTAGITAIGAEDGVVCSDVEFIVEGTTGGIFNYGDGNVGSSPSHTYTSAGEYTVTYSVNVSGCSASGSTTFNVEIPTATIVSTPGFGCEIPAEFSYTLESEFDITEQEWSFAGQNGTETNPLNSTLANPSTVFTYDDDNEFSINGLKLLFTSATFVTDNGCVGTASTNVDTVALPNALAYVDIDQGCAPLDVSFTNESSYLFPENLVNAVWHFGDGNTAETGPDEDIQYTYTSTGEFEAFVVVTTTEGCIDTSFFHDIMVGEEIIPSFTISPDDICRDDSVTLTNTSADIDLIDAYSYSADLNTLSSCSDEENPTFAFNDFAGTAEITQFVEYNGCISSSTQSVDVAGPVGKIHYTCDCSTPFEYTFTLFDQNGNLQVYDADSWTWDFGDGTTIENSTETEVTHTYAETGDYEAALTTFNDATGCDPHTSTVLIKVRDLKASLQFDTLACAGTTVSFSAVDLQDVASNNGGCYRNYLWDFGDNTRPVKTLGANEEHVFQNGGDYTVSLSVKDDNECVITTVREISIFGIQASYEADTLVGCLPLEVNFTDLSTADTTIVSWNWDFDINGNFSDEQNPTFTFEEAEFVGANPQVYDIVLTVTDALGCTDVVNTLNITPQVPNPAFFASSSTDICVGEDVSFQPANNLATNTYNWDYGNGSTSEGALGNTIYNEPGQYSVFLSVTDNLGFFNEDSLIAVVDVQAFPIPEIASIV
ncbi:MAG: PKD domain-containing protein, partial [Flavobacteriales bacterium]|nr:PKD domain-containing protein [Flavobacteriales bacterium]